MKNQPLNSKNYSIIFVALFFLILLSQLFVPEFNIKTISKNYLWRKNLISGYNTFRYEIGDRLFSNMVIGKDEGFYFTGEASIPDFQRTSVINVSKMKRLTKFFNNVNQQVSSYGGTLLIVIPPNKITIYPHFMPDEIPVLGEISSLDRLINYLNENSDIRIIDLRSSLIEASSASPVYYQTDTHWNCYGAYFAYQSILSKIGQTYPQVMPRPIDDFDIILSESQPLDITRSLGLDIKESLQSIVPKFSADDSRDISLNLLMFHDSFYNACLNQYLDTAFGEIISIPYNDVHEKDYLQVIDTQKPDIVVIEFLERYIEYFLSTTYDE
jgi:hypothetical protein